MFSTLVLLALLEVPAHAGDLVVEADRIVLDADAMHGEGNVVVQIGDATVSGSTFTATMQASPTVTVTDAEVSDGPISLTAQTLTLDGQTLSGVGVSYTGCGCQPTPPWRLTAAEAELVPDESVRVRGATLRLLEVPVLPIPTATLPLKRRSGLLLPTVGHGSDGWRFAQPLYVTLGRTADLTFTPEVRTKRSVRLLGEARYALRGGGGSLTGALGHDYMESGPRGAAAWTHGWANGTLLTATRGEWTGDRAYYADYGDRFLERGRPYDEARLLLGAGPVEVGADLFQSGEPTDHLVADLAVYQPTGPILAGVLGAASVRAGYRVHGSQAWEATGGSFILTSHTALERPFGAGPVRVSALAQSHVSADEAGGLLHFEAGVDARLPAWRRGARGMSHFEPQLVVLYGGHATVGQVPYDALPPRWTASPRLLYRHTGRVGWAEATTGMTVTLTGWQLDLGGQVRTGPWSGWLQGGGGPDGPGLGTAGVQWGTARGALEMAWMFSPERLLYQPDPDDPRGLHQLRSSARWALPGPLRTLTLSASSAIDVDGIRWLHRGGGIRWTHPTGCLGVGMEARLDADRSIPDLGLTLEVKP